eukprot:8539299-Ditylum_brightwellii.AAC.2
MLSKEQHEDAEGLWTFGKVLNHRTIKSCKIKVEVMWDNGGVLWEPLAMMCKDDPVILAGYAKERKLLEQYGWKWTKNISKQEKKFLHLLRIIKSSK